jgi:hypothetical protein
MMFARISGLLCFLLVGLLLLTGCSAAPSSTWTLAWASSPRAAQVYTPQAAYMASVRAQRPDGSLLAPVANTWLATGQQPRVGLAFSQLDAAARFSAIGIITIDPGSNRWTLTESGTLARPERGQGVPAAQATGRGWSLPAGTYASLALEVPDTQPGGSVQFWVSDSNQQFILARLYSTMQPPAIHTVLTLAGQPGWEATQGRFTVIALTLTSGIYQGLGTLIFAGTTGSAQSEQLAARAAANLNDVLPA